MNEHSHVLMERLERLERSNRRLKLLSLVVLAAIGTMGAAGIPHTFDTLNVTQLNAQGISVIDANGKLRVSIGADPASDGGGMAVFQRDGIARVGIGINDNNAAASFNDPSGTLSTAIIALEDGRGVISTFEPTGSLGAVLVTNPGADGLNGLVVYQPDGVQRAFIVSNSFNTNFSLLHASSGSFAVHIFDQADGSARGFFMRDQDGTTRLSMGEVDSSTGSPFDDFEIFGADGIVRASMDWGLGSNNGLVHTFDQFGVQNGLLGVP